MVTIGIDPHKQTHSAVATEALGSELAQRTVTARREDPVSCWTGVASLTASGCG